MPGSIKIALVWVAGFLIAVLEFFYNFAECFSAKVGESCGFPLWAIISSWMLIGIICVWLSVKIFRKMKLAEIEPGQASTQLGISIAVLIFLSLAVYITFLV